VVTQRLRQDADEAKEGDEWKRQIERACDSFHRSILAVYTRHWA